MQFLMGLNKTYSAIRSQILLMNHLPFIRQAYSSISQEDKLRLLSSTHTSTNSSRDLCDHCGNFSHWIQKCYKLHGYTPGHLKAKMNSGQNSNRHKGISMADQVGEVSNTNEGHPKAKMNSGQNLNRHKGIFVVDQVGEVSNTNEGSLTTSDAQLKQLLSPLNNQNEGSHSKANAVTNPGLSKIASRNLIIDSGVTYHITSSSNLLHKDNNCSLPPVLLPSEERSNNVAKGFLPLNYVYYLHDVLSVCTFKVDLMSDLAMRSTIGLVALATKQSVTKPSSSNNRAVCNLTISSTDLWHNRLGHISYSRLSFIAKNFLNFSVESNNACLICSLAK
ncbi:hypothetical protein CISIN_1g037253mg [Citrus sinensis]|uniref:GAG-pre-integrase domain-containing protein n=1 Tax=Citrus sinensis TaxID=2711 RepID=A0A067DT70_CITSI|nr:hypothetical protein CISIN_1g037253mg [Citrus sinensis]